MKDEYQDERCKLKDEYQDELQKDLKKSQMKINIFELLELK